MCTLADPPVLPICIDRDRALLGPIWQPGRSVCPDCLDHWLSINFFDHPDEPGPLHRDLPVLICEAALALVARPSALDDHGIAICAAGKGTAAHPVFRRQDCKFCGVAGEQAVDTSLHAQLRMHCSPWTGIVNRLELTKEPSAGAFRATATWTPPLPIDDARGYLHRQESYGRGRTAREAETGCIAEALERYSLIYRGNEATVRGTIDEVDGINPDEIQLYSAAQYRDRAAWNAQVEEELEVPELFDATVPVDWLKAIALDPNGRGTFVPAACCLMWYQFQPGEPEFARADTIGCASGTTFDDAAARALLEWIERDATTIWWDNALGRPGLRIESFDSDDLNTVVDGLRAIDRRLFLLDCTTDIGVPAYVAIAPRRDGSEPLIACAADLSPSVAAYRAASEVGQVWYDAQRSGDGLLPSLREWLLTETTKTQPYLKPTHFVDAPSAPTYSQDRLKILVDRLVDVGLQPYAVDHSRTDVTLPTVRAVVPGLRHGWNRRAPGRLYDVPVKMGWLSRSKAEEELNPIRCSL
jgi:thiazole/oxazole-forming peptide maturase SagD family component